MRIPPASLGASGIPPLDTQAILALGMRSFAARTSQLLVVHWLFCDELVLSSFWVPAKRLALAVRNLIQAEVRRSTLCCSAGLFSQTTEANSNRRVFFLGPRSAFGYICLWDRQKKEKKK